MSSQRQLKRKEKLDPDRQKRLEEIGFEWVLLSAKWETMHAPLQQFKKREVHCDGLKSHMREDGANLGKWTGTQRQLKRKGMLGPDRQKRLEDIGFEWVLLSGIWDATFALLRQFKKREGTAMFPVRTQRMKLTLVGG